MKIYIIILIIGFFLINAYIYWMGKKIVPFSRPISLDSGTYTFAIEKLYPGKHKILLYFKERNSSGKSIYNVDKKFSFTVKIKEAKNNISAFNNNFDVANMHRTLWGVKYIDNIDVGYEIEATEQTTESYDFKPSYFNKYNMEIKISNPDITLNEFKPTIGLFCHGIDDGYFGIQYLVYNALFLLSMALFVIIRWVLKR
jgi:hypothetical protein